MIGTLATREQAFAWELRGYWARGTEVVAVLDQEIAQLPRVRGIVVRVAATGAVAWFDDGGDGEVTVPCAAIVNLRRPHFHEDGVSVRRRVEPRRPAPPEGQISLFDVEEPTLDLQEVIS